VDGQGLPWLVELPAGNPLGELERRIMRAFDQVRTATTSRTDWLRVRTTGTKAPYVQRLTKVQRVLVIGRLEISERQTPEGRDAERHCPLASARVLRLYADG
jgi:hypothetical protein